MSENLGNKIDIRSLTISSFSNPNVEIDILPYYIGITLSESIYSKFTKGFVDVVEGVGYSSTLPIIGEEYINMTFKMPHMEEEVERTFFVYSITNRKKVTEHQESYSLNFVSFEYFLGITNRISESYKSKKIDEIINQSVGSFFELDEVDQTNGLYDIIIPNLTVNESINFLLTRALNSDNIPDFVFYQNLLGEYKFKSISNLHQQNTKIDLLFFRNEMKVNLNDSIKSVIAENIDQTRNNESSINAGMYANRRFFIDTNLKTYEEDDLILKDISDSFSKISKFNFYSDDFADAMSNPLTRVTLHPYGHVDRITNWLHTRVMQSKLMNQITISLKMDGFTRLNAGDMIVYDRPATSPEYSVDENGRDSYLAGRYMVSSIKHQIAANNFHTILELSKDSLEDKI